MDDKRARYMQDIEADARKRLWRGIKFSISILFTLAMLVCAFLWATGDSSAFMVIVVLAVVGVLLFVTM